MELRVVTHCISPPGITHYAKCLKWQWASLLSYPTDPFDSVCLTVCMSVLDDITFPVVEQMLNEEHPSVRVEIEAKEPSQLCRRAIARNAVALRSQSDIIWFADADYFIGKGFYQSVAEHVLPGETLYGPQEYFINVNHALGDAMLARDKFEFDYVWFAPRKMGKAIGGQMFVPRQLAQKGYLDGTKWQKEVPPEQGFGATPCDVAYRKSCGGSTHVPIKGLYRIRHTVNGRDYSMTDGKRIG